MKCKSAVRNSCAVFCGVKSARIFFIVTIMKEKIELTKLKSELVEAENGLYEKKKKGNENPFFRF